MNQKPKPIGVLVDPDLWKRFRIHALESGTSASKLLEMAMEDYLKRNAKK